MNPVTTSVFDLPDRLAPKADPALTAQDERHFAAVAKSLEQAVAETSGRLDAARRAPGGAGRAAMDRDLEVHRLTGRLRALRRFGLDLCLGRIVPAHGATDGTANGTGTGEGTGVGTATGDDDNGGPVYIGRLGLTDSEGRRLLLDWRSPAAAPFFAATHADPMGLASRRRYRWTNGRITDYWDEVFAAEGLEGHAALDDQSAFIATLGGSRSARMRDVLATIQADQDAVVRAGSRGALVVDGGPGTGKTVVALHRSAYLLHSDPRLGHRRGGLLFVGPHQPYLDYVADVLPSLGEEGVRTCTVRDLVPEGAGAPAESDPEAARLKASADMVRAVEKAVRIYEEPPTEGMAVSTDWEDLWLSAEDWAEAFGAPDPGTPHNEAREQIWAELAEILLAKLDGGEDIPVETFLRSLRRDGDLVDALHRAWPLLEAADLVGDLWTVPAYLRLCAPWLAPEDVRRLRRADPRAWTVSDLPVLDAARRRLGDPETARRRRRQDAALAAERERMAEVIGDILAADDDGEGAVTMLRGQDLKDTLVDGGALPAEDPDRLAGPFAHVVVDEAQELTDAEWQMLLARCPSRSFTIVGDRAQARDGFAESWQERLARIGIDRSEVASLSVNYRTPEEVMAEAEPVIRAALPDANVPTSVRRSGVPVTHGSVAELDGVLDGWLREHAEGTACVIGDAAFTAAFTAPAAGSPGADRIRALTPELAKGLEFDLVVLVDPASFGEGVAGAVDRYVAMTRATRRLVVLTPA
ncbi:RNA polymerase recycling motor ATPase HelR [Kitasatospora sp. NPDC056327]|uniref:RNA polymerase recycling motor ATPase HelR n=1 Tax=Kitasatospora sp. NPDC056327 TaxID=3345785 RepID=UPI0035DF7513